jgi:hypothetical protein
MEPEANSSGFALTAVALEEPMSSLNFRHPITIFVGLGFPTQISGVPIAYQILNEWNGVRDFVHSLALKTCRDALQEGSGSELARLRFEEFASARGILAAEMFPGASVHSGIAA